MRKLGADFKLREGRYVSAEARAPLRFRRSINRAILLIHGYNVSEDKAVVDLGEFRDALSYYAPDLKDHTYTCAWAGNWGMPGVRVGAYPFMLGQAKASSTTLLETIQEIYQPPSGPEELIIIAHSLGCRVTLEMLHALQADGGRPAGLKRLVVILMAAAVPIEHVDKGGLLASAVTVPDVTIVLHSEDDWVLSRVFGLGQTMGGDGWFPEAVGLRGRPQTAPWSKTKQMHAFTHGDYWAELETAELVCAMLQIQTRRGAISGAPLATRKRLRQNSLPATGLLPMAPHFG
jgi:hypothetical protein